MRIAQFVIAYLLPFFKVTHSENVLKNTGSAQCFRLLTEGFNNTKNLSMWAKMLDASSKIPPAIFTGNIIDFGSFDECLEIAEYVKDFGMIKGKYCLGAIMISPNMLQVEPTFHENRVYDKIFRKKDYQEHNVKEIKPTDSLYISLALCIPHLCSPNDIKILLKNTSLPNIGINYKLNSQASCQFQGDGNYDASTGDWLALIFVATIILFMVICTFYDLYLRHFNAEPLHPILLTFSVYTNGQKLMKISNSPSNIACLHGLRFFSIIWIIIGHRYSSAMDLPSTNLIQTRHWREEKVYTQYIQAATVAVDTFLFITGFLTTISLYRYLSKGKKLTPSKIGLMYFHRYLRLTPALIGLYIFQIYIIKFLGGGPLWDSMFNLTKQPCFDNWWSLFLYIQNYVVEYDNMCMLHTWYLSMDMQIFIISPLIIIVMWKLNKTAYAYIGILILLSIICPFVTAIVYETQIFQDTYYRYYYYWTHNRLAPWFVGVLLGHIVDKFKDKKFYIGKLSNFIIWMAVLSGMGAIIFCGHDVTYNYRVLNSAFYIALHRAAWAVGLCWIVFSCTKGYGGIVNSFLSIPVLQVFSKLTYSMYLVHMLILMISIGNMRNAEYIDDYVLMYKCCGDILFTSVLSIFWVLAFESPYASIYIQLTLLMWYVRFVLLGTTAIFLYGLK